MTDPITATPLGLQIGSWIFKYISTKVLDEFKDRWIKPFLKRQDVEKAFSNTVSVALSEFQTKYPELYKSLFDETFVKLHAVPELSKLLRRTDQPDIQVIAANYNSYFQFSDPPDIKPAIEFFVSAVTENMKAESALQELISNRQIECISGAVERIEPAINQLLEGMQSIVIATGAGRDAKESLPAVLDAETGNRIVKSLGTKAVDLLSWPQLLHFGEWIERPELGTLLSTICENNNSITVILGAPGSGKSALMARLGNELVEKGYDLAAIKADLLPRTVDTPEALAQWLHLPDLFDRCLTRLSVENSVVLLIDQLDALCSLIDLHTGRLTVLLELVNNLPKSNVHLVLSCRDFEFRHDVRFSRLDAEQVVLALPTWEQVSGILSSYELTTTGWPENFREILRTPQYLKIFLEYLKEKQQPVFTSYQAMLEDVWQSKVVGEDNNKRRADLLQTLAAQMAMDEELWAPTAKYDAFKNEIVQLEAHGILSRSPDKLKIGFSHQTLFDFTRARAFTVESGCFSEYVLKRQDALFVRPTLWSTLVYLRGADKAAYHVEFERLWKTETLRIHVRFLMMEYLGQVTEPDEQEVAWLLPALENQRTVRRTLWVMQGNPGWFKLVDGTYLPGIMAADKDEAWHATWFLSRAWPFAREEILALIEHYWLPTSEKDSHSFKVLESLNVWDERSCEFIETILRRTPVQSGQVCWLVSTVSALTPRLAPRIVATQLRSELERAKKEVAKNIEKLPEVETEENLIVRSMRRSDALCRPYRNVLESSNWHDLEVIAEAAPDEFIECVFPWFVELVEAISDEEHPFLARYRDDSSLATSDRSGRELSQHYPIVAAIKAAIKVAASENHTWFFDFLKRWETSSLAAVHRMLVVGLRQLCVALPCEVLAYLLDDKRRLAIGAYSDQHWDTKKLINDLAPILAREQLKSLEKAIISWSQYNHYPPEDTAKIRFERKKWDREHRLRLLRAIPTCSLSFDTKKLIVHEERALGNVPDWDSRIGGGGFIGSPVSAEQMEKGKDEDILGLFQELDDDSGWDHPRFHMKGGSIQASRAFAEFAKLDPDRALSLIMQFQPGKQERPVAEALRALSESGNISAEKLFSLVLELEAKGFSADFYRHDMAHALTKVASEPCGLPDSICDLLKSWLVPYEPEKSNLADQQDEGGNDSTNNKEESFHSILWNHFGHRVLPGGNYWVLEALFLGYLLRRPCDYEKWLDLLESHLKNAEDTEVWQAFSEHLKWLRNADQNRSEQIIETVLYRYLHHTEAGVFLVALVHHWISPAIIKPWIESLKDGTWEKGAQAYGELIILCHASGPAENISWYLEQIEAALSDSEIEDPLLTRIRLGCAFAAAHLWGEPGFIPVVAPILLRLIPLAKNPIASAVLHLLNQKDPLPINDYTRSILDAIIENPQILKEGSNHFMTEKLSNLLPVEAERVYRVCMALLDQRKDDFAGISNSFAVNGDELIDISLTLQRIGSHREKGLELFERLLDLDAYGIRDTLIELDRRPSSDGAPLRQRRRRKK
jgi:hypothetical protein